VSAERGRVGLGEMELLCCTYSLHGWAWCTVAFSSSTVVLLQSNAGGILAMADVEKSNYDFVE